MDLKLNIKMRRFPERNKLRDGVKDKVCFCYIAGCHSVRFLESILTVPLIAKVCLFSSSTFDTWRET